jgi:hypothetical protein
VVGAFNTLAQYSTYSVGSNTILELQNTGTGNFSNTISFSGNNATLKLDTPNSFTGIISGFALTDKIDLVGVVASSVTYNNSTNVLTVNTGSGARTFTLTGALVGDMVTSTSDGNGGTLISFNPSATSANWLGTTGTSLSAPYYTTYYDWSTSSNWSNGVPVSSADVSINGSINPPTINSAATISSLTLNAGSLVVGTSGILNVTNALTLSGSNYFNNFAGTMSVGSLVFANTGSYSNLSLSFNGGKFSTTAITYTSSVGLSLNGNGEFNFGTATNTSSTPGNNLSLNINANNNTSTTNGVQSISTLKVVGA